MKITRTNLAVVTGLVGGLVPMVANAAADAAITAGITSATTKFADNFGAVSVFWLSCVVTVVAMVMLVKYIRKSH